MAVALEIKFQFRKCSIKLAPISKFGFSWQADFVPLVTRLPAGTSVTSVLRDLAELSKRSISRNF